MIFFEKGIKFIEETQTKNSIALEMLVDFIVKLERDKRSFEWDMLPEEEKARIRKSNEELKEKYRKEIG